MLTNWSHRAASDMAPMDPDYQPSVGAVTRMLEQHRDQAAGDPKKADSSLSGGAGRRSDAVDDGAPQSGRTGQDGLGRVTGALSELARAENGSGPGGERVGPACAPPPLEPTSLQR